MGVIEDIGEGTIRIAARIYGAINDAWSKTEENRIYPFFNRKGIEYRDYTVLKAQLAALLFLLLSVLYVFGLINTNIYALSLLVGGYPLILLPRLRDLYREDYPAYRDFFLGYLTVAILLVVLKTAKPVGHPLLPNLHLVIFSVIYIAGFSYLFKKKYGRNYTYGRVIQGGPLARVKLNYDLRASVKPTVAMLNNDAGAEKGDIVVVEVDSSLLNLRGRKPLRILEVHKE